MNQLEIAQSIGRRFHRPIAASVLACASTRHPILFSHVVSEVAMPARTLPPPVEDAFAIHVHHRPLRNAETWLEGRHALLPPVDQGGIFIFDLRTEPTAQIHESFEFSRFHLPQATIDELGYEQGMRRVGNLRSDPGHHDPVIYHLALAMVRRVEALGEEQDSLFKDGIALAFFAHVAPIYGGALSGSLRAGTLAPWQVRRVGEWIDANLQAPMSIADLAAVVNLSRSHFARAFSRSTGLPPHRFVLQRRVAQAKRLLKTTGLALSEISATCGFVDQSHFTKIFAAFERSTPGRWRRLNR
jgi:AraC family transcriptional regulator